MTQGRYYWMLLLKSCGIKIAQRCLENATYEMHLFKDAQELIGFYNSDYVEHIDELKTEYWEIKNFKAQIQEIEQKEAEIELLLEGSVKRHGQMNVSKSQEVLELEQQIQQVLDKREEYLEQRTQIFNQGKAIRKIYDGLKTKMEYQGRSQEATEAEIADTRARLEQCVAQLTALKEERDQVIQIIEAIEQQVALKEEALKESKQNSQTEAFESSANLGDLNREITLLRSEKQNLINNLNKNIRYVGRFLFANRQDKEVAQCIKKNKELVQQAKVLRKSVILNHRLVDNRVQMIDDNH